MTLTEGLGGPEVPPPTVELLVNGLLLRALVRGLSSKRRRRLLRELMDGVEEWESGRAVRHIRSPASDAQVNAAKLAAAAYVRPLVIALGGWVMIEEGKRKERKRIRNQERGA